MSFVLGFLTAVALAVLAVLLFPVIWLLSGGDLDMHHWLLDGDGSLRNRWRNREWNGLDPRRGED